jgi:hypothetical protein
VPARNRNTPASSSDRVPPAANTQLSTPVLAALHRDKGLCVLGRLRRASSTSQAKIRIRARQA